MTHESELSASQVTTVPPQIGGLHQIERPDGSVQESGTRCERCGILPRNAECEAGTCPENRESGTTTATPDLEAIRKRCEAASAGPWRACGCGKCSQLWSIPFDCPVAVGLTLHDEGYTCGEGVSRDAANANAEFIAHARTDIPELLAEVARITSERDEWERTANAFAADVVEYLDEIKSLRSENSRLAALIAEAIRWRAGNWSQTAGALNKLAASTREEGS